MVQAARPEPEKPAPAAGGQPIKMPSAGQTTDAARITSVLVKVGDKDVYKRQPQEVFDHPANLFVAGFIGTPQMNFFDAKLLLEGGRYFVTTGAVKVTS